MAYSAFTRAVLKHNGIATKHWASHLKQDVTSVDLPVSPDEGAILDYFQYLKDSNSAIMLFGDSDCDGTSGLAVLRKWFKHAGFITHPICLRRDVGYGLNTQIIQQYKDDHNVKLLITADCGISNRVEIHYAATLGIDTIITDHHTPPADPNDLPGARFILHPEIMGIKDLANFSGAGMAYYLVSMLEKRFPTDLDLVQDLLPIATLGQVGDMVALKGMGRDLIKLGIRHSQTTNIPGIEALKRIAKLDAMTEEDMAFQIIPRLNSAGRMRDPMLSFAVLATEDPEAAERAADTLDKLNQQRKELKADYMDMLHETIDTSGNVLCVAGDFLGGLVGLCAAGLVERYNKPAFVMSTQGETLRGSSRCPEWFNVYDALHHCAPALLKYGGHKQAAGFSLAHDKLALFQTLLEEAYALQLDQPAPEKVYLDWQPEYAESLMEDVKLLRPLGQGFQMPTFRTRAVIEQASPSRSFEHLFGKIHGFKAVGFGLWDPLLTEPLEREILFTVGTSSYGRKRPYIQLQIKEINDV